MKQKRLQVFQKEGIQYRELKANTSYTEQREKRSGRRTPDFQKIRKNGEGNCNKIFMYESNENGKFVNYTSHHQEYIYFLDIAA